MINPSSIGRAPSNAASAIRFDAKQLIMVSGQVGWDDGGRVCYADDPPRQIRKAFENLQAVLSEAGAEWDDVVKLNVYLTDRRFREDARRIREEFLRDHRPPSTTVIVAGLVEPELVIEVDAIAVAPQRTVT